jgi:hypothetical protein
MFKNSFFLFFFFSFPWSFFFFFSSFFSSLTMGFFGGKGGPRALKGLLLVVLVTLAHGVSGAVHVRSAVRDLRARAAVGTVAQAAGAVAAGAPERCRDFPS